MATLSKREIVLDMMTVDRETARYYGAFDPADLLRDPLETTLTITRQAYDELGGPLQVTLTIEPGDRLNDEQGG